MSVIKGIYIFDIDLPEYGDAEARIKHVNNLYAQSEFTQSKFSLTFNWSFILVLIDHLYLFVC